MPSAKEQLARSFLGLLLGAATLQIAACTFLPSAGPSGFMIKHNAGKSDYELLPINGETLQAIASTSKKADYMAAGGRKSDRMFGARGIEALSAPTSHAITAGDVVSVAIYETDSALFRGSLAAGAGGALSVNPMTALPPQVIDQTGEITVPFVGRVRALGKLPSDVEREVRDGLRLKTADPQVVVTVIERKGGNLASITGDVRQPSQIQLSLAGTRILDAIAQAGGTPSAPHDTMVTLTRGGATRSDPLQDIYDTPAKNVTLMAGDTVVLRKRALSFMAFGSTGRVGSYPIPIEDINLSEAVALSGGPADLQANPATVFVYRQEPAELLRALGREPRLPGATVPIVYQLDLHNPEGFFYANNFTVRDRDVVYYAAAGSAGVQKFMGLINTFLAPAIGGAGAAASVSILTAP